MGLKSPRHRNASTKMRLQGAAGDDALQQELRNKILQRECDVRTLDGLNVETLNSENYRTRRSVHKRTNTGPGNMANLMATRSQPPLKPGHPGGGGGGPGHPGPPGSGAKHKLPPHLANKLKKAVSSGDILHQNATANNKIKSPKASPRKKGLNLRPLFFFCFFFFAENRNSFVCVTYKMK